MIIYFTIFIIGTVIGSFLNVCICRIPRDESIAYPPSHCDSCNNEIKAYDLIPILSYMILGGRCRHCKEKILIRYPLVEAAIGIMFLSLYIKYGISVEFIKFTVLMSIIVVAGMIDLDTTDVYFITTVIGVIGAFLFLAMYFYMGLPIKSYIYGGILGWSLLAFIIVITKGSMGWGDAEICLVCGLLLGLKLTAVMLVFSFVLGSFSGITLILLGKKTRKDYVPFGPFIVAATIIVVFYGQTFLSWYLY